MTVLRCAVYTRKSTEDGLEQEFNSLDAQREACEAYVTSQRHEGWALVPDRYDDGGFSGGSMERPGLKALLADIEASKVDVIVVYKVDRLTRSLADFAKIVERLDAKKASFVSVTQAFNTTSSMGRLTLNVLLSFAQFEREVTGERIRDKIAASKKKGLWMGGPVPLGYEVVARKLVPVPEEAARVRTIMQRYLEIRSVPRLLEQLRGEGVVTKIQQRTGGPHRGGIAFARGSLFYLLKNPVYRGKIVHRGKVYDGEHEPIITQQLWDAVQAQLAEKAPPRQRPTNDKQDALLKGMLSDADGRPMVPTYGCSRQRRYTYYETRKDLVQKSRTPGQRVGRRQLEHHLVEQLCSLLGDQHRLRRLAGVEDAGALRTLFATAHLLEQHLDDIPKVHSTVKDLVKSITLTADRMQVILDPAALSIERDAPLICQFALPQRKPFREAKLRIDTETLVKPTNSDLTELIGEASAARKLILQSAELSLNQLGKREGRCRTHLARLFRISFLSPKIVEAIVEGTQPKSLSRRLLLVNDLPISWVEQERMFGLQR